jgi:hypothetical protein
MSGQANVWMNDRHGKRIALKLMAEFDDIEVALEEKGMLSYQLFLCRESSTMLIGRLLFPWMAGWKYEGTYFNEVELRNIGQHIYHWVGLWADRKL